jgi:signal peptidase I
MNEHSTAFLTLSVELLEQGCGIRFRAGGGSMTPAIKDGALITVAPINPAEVKPGDVLLYRRQERVIAHRVVQISEAGASFVLRGDAACADDELVKAEQVLGKVVLVERAERRTALFTRKAPLRNAARALVSRLRRKNGLL